MREGAGERDLLAKPVDPVAASVEDEVDMGGTARFSDVFSSEASDRGFKVASTTFSASSLCSCSMLVVVVVVVVVVVIKPSFSVCDGVMMFDDRS